MIVVYAQAAGAGLRSLEEIPLADRLVGALVSYQAYFGKFFIPSGFAIFYPFTTFAPGIGAGALCGLLALSYCAFRASTRHPYLLLAWLWFLISLLPVIGIVQIGGQIFADRWTYLAHIGLCVGSVWYLRELLSARTKLRFALAALTVLLCFFITRNYLPNWRSSESLFRHTLEVSPHNFMAHTNLGSALDQSGKLDQAALHYEEAARLNPTYPEALNNLGTLRARQRRLSEAAQLLERALSLRPRFRSARYNLGLVYNDQGNSVAALAAWIQVLELNSNDSAALNSIGFVLNAQLRQPCAASITSSSALDRDKFRQQLRILSAGALQPDLYASLQQLGRCFE
jgi:Flp pilus assembly protein TadD